MSAFAENVEWEPAPKANANAANFVRGAAACAHTIGDAVAFLPTEGILFTGDLCVNRRSGNNVGDRDADHRHWVQVLNDLARWDVKTKEIDLSRHGDFAADEQQNQSAIRAVFRKAPQ